MKEEQLIDNLIGNLNDIITIMNNENSDLQAKYITLHGELNGRDFVLSSNYDLQSIIESMFSYMLSGIQKLPIEKQTTLINNITTELNERVIRISKN